MSCQKTLRKNFLMRAIVLTSSAHREVEKLTKNWQHFLMLYFSTNNSHSSNRFFAPESPLAKLCRAFQMPVELLAEASSKKKLLCAFSLVANCVTRV